APHKTPRGGAPRRGQNPTTFFASPAPRHAKTREKPKPAGTRRMFGENSDTRQAMIVDGTSNTVMIAETTLEVYNGRTPAWAYRGWVQVGIDPGLAVINDWTYNSSTGPIVPQPGRVGSWARMGSRHPGGAHAAFADGSVH